MRSEGRQQRIDALRAEIGSIERGSAVAHPVLPFGVPAIDAHLPGEGLATGALHEAAPGVDGLSHDAAATLFVAAALARLPGTVFWCLRRRDLFAPGLAAAGLHPDRLIYVEASSDTEVLAVMEECLRYSGLGGVVGEVARLSMVASRRLQLAAETSGVIAFALHRAPLGEEPTAALTRWQVACLPTPPLPVPGLGPSRWRLSLVRARGASPRDWIVEGPDAQGHLALASDLPDRSAAPADGAGRASERAAA